MRSLSVRACDLLLYENEQLSLLPEIAAIQKRETLEGVVDDIRSRFGHFSIQSGLQLSDRQLSALHPRDDHLTYSESFAKGKI